MTEPATPEARISAIASDLIDCRQRGIDLIDRDTPKQPRKQLVHLEELARKYCEARKISATTRIEQISTVLRDGLAAYRDSGEERRATFFEKAFFDPPDVLAPLSAGQRLDLAMAYHLDTKQAEEPISFDGLRPLIFKPLARFLVRFVDDAKITREAPLEPTRTRQFPRWLVPVAGAAVFVLLAGVIFWLTRPDSDAPASHKPDSNPATSAAGSNAPVVATKTYTQISGNRNGTRVFNDPRTPGRTMPDIPFMQPVEVSCRLYAPSMGSVTWWYRLASPPYNNEWWSPAVTFLNGDNPEGPYLHDVDESVPVCEGV